MKINIKKAGLGHYTNVEVLVDGHTLDLGLHDQEEVKALAETLLDAVWELSPGVQVDAVAWVKDRLDTCGIELEEPSK